MRTIDLDDAAMSDVRRPPWRCRRHGHDWRIPPVEATPGPSLVCRRCGASDSLNPKETNRLRRVLVVAMIFDERKRFADWSRADVETWADQVIEEYTIMSRVG